LRENGAKLERIFVSRTPRETAVLEVDPLNPDRSAIRRAAQVLRAGGLVAFPTETVYGLGADATSEAAVRGIFEAKGRPASDPLIVHVADADDLASVAGKVPKLAAKLGERFWPGPLTLVVPRGEAIPAIVSSGRDTVAVRVPRHPVALALIRQAGVPIAAPSANLFSRPSPTRAAHVLEDLDGRIDMILDGGPAAVGVESTVLDLTVDPPQVLRPGGTGLEELAVVLGEVSFQPRTANAGAAQASPGMLLKHYSPRARMLLVAGGPERLRRLAREALDKGERVGVLLYDEDSAALEGLAVETGRLGPAGEPEQAAGRLFDQLRRLDRLGVDVILARAPPKEGLGLAVWDRLFRAAQGRVEGG
jgi:L-threonylcarbamoyladenylate synthase